MNRLYVNDKALNQTSQWFLNFCFQHGEVVVSVLKNEYNATIEIDPDDMFNCCLKFENSVDLTRFVIRWT